MSTTSQAQRATEDDTLKGLFNSLIRQWKEERGPSSSTTELAMCPSYQRIIGLGAPAIPLLLRELERAPDHYFWALKAITGVDPVPTESRGKVREMTRLWVDWGRQHGYTS
jgi:hypothetical protein